VALELLLVDEEGRLGQLPQRFFILVRLG